MSPVLALLLCLLPAVLSQGGFPGGGMGGYPGGGMGGYPGGGMGGYPGGGMGGYPGGGMGGYPGGGMGGGYPGGGMGGGGYYPGGGGMRCRRLGEFCRSDRECCRGLECEGDRIRMCRFDDRR